MSTYVCTKCGVEAHSKCVQQRNIFLSHDQSWGGASANLIDMILYPYTARTDEDGATTIKARNTSLVDMLELLRTVTTDEIPFVVCNLTSSHSWKFVAGDDGKDTCMFGCCHK